MPEDFLGVNLTVKPCGHHVAKAAETKNIVTKEERSKEAYE
jgi:hypothetical protein